MYCNERLLQAYRKMGEDNSLDFSIGFSFVMLGAPESILAGMTGEVV